MYLQQRFKRTSEKGPGSKNSDNLKSNLGQNSEEAEEKEESLKSDLSPRPATKIGLLCGSNGKAALSLSLSAVMADASIVFAWSRTSLGTILLM